MKNVNQLERDKREVLLNMDKEEIIAYFENISKKQLKTYPKLTKEGVTSFNYVEYNRLESILNESNKILSSKYRNIEFLSILSKYVELNSVYDETLEEAKILYLTKHLTNLYYIVKGIEEGLSILQEHLTFYYFRYFYKFTDIIEILKIANLPEETISEVNESLLKEEYNPKMFKTPFEIGYDFILESIVKDLEKSVKNFKKLHQLEENPIEVLNPKYVPEEVIELFSLIYDMFIIGNALLEDYEKLKENPFMEGVELTLLTHLEVIFNETISDLDSFEESLTDEKDIKIFNLLKDSFSSDVPEYDFKEFKLILPERDEER